MTTNVSGDLMFSSSTRTRMRLGALVGSLFLLSANVEAVQEVQHGTFVSGAGISQGGDHILRSAVGLSVVGVSTSADHVHTVNPFQFLANAAVVDPPVSLGVNRTFNFDETTRHNGATVSWDSRFPGVVDFLRYRISGETVWGIAEGPFTDVDPTVLDGVVALVDAEIDPSNSVASEVREVLQNAGIGLDLLDQIVALDRAVRTRHHSVTVSGLLSDRPYEYEAESVSLRGASSSVQSGTFQTRRFPDLRPVTGTDLDLQSTSTTVVATWLTNRVSDSKFILNEVGMPPAGEVHLDQEEGSRFQSPVSSG